MNAALIVFDNMTALDFVGFYDAVTRLQTMKITPEFEWAICARQPQVRDDRGLTIHADAVDQSLADFDLVYVPGGYGTRSLQHDTGFIDWMRTASAAPLKVSVCTGALLLGAAGFLRGLKATTHPTALDELKPYCAQVVRQRIVDEGNVVTAGGVSTSIDLGLHIVERLAGKEARVRVARQMDYPYSSALVI
jgi:transcriptional regulator GlxA family with amidase domain